MSTTTGSNGNRCGKGSAAVCGGETAWTTGCLASCVTKKMHTTSIPKVHTNCCRSNAISAGRC